MICHYVFSGPIEVLSQSTGRIISRAKEYNSHRHWRITAKPGEQIVLKFSNLWLDFHVNCSYDYIEVIHVIEHSNDSHQHLRCSYKGGKDTYRHRSLTLQVVWVFKDDNYPPRMVNYPTEN